MINHTESDSEQKSNSSLQGDKVAAQTRAICT